MENFLTESIYNDSLSTIYQSVEKKFNRQYIYDNLQPEGVFLTDTFHDFMIPVKDEIHTDKQPFQIDQLATYYQKNYLYPKNSVFLPAHYYIEYVNRSFHLFQKRPINYKSLYKPYFTNYITIVTLGNSNTDVYDNKYYRILADIIINPLIHIKGWRQLYTIQSLDDINNYNATKGNFVIMMGKNFNINLLKNNLQVQVQGS